MAGPCEAQTFQGFDAGGVRLGMSVADVNAVLDAAGYRHDAVTFAYKEAPSQLYTKYMRASKCELFLFESSRCEDRMVIRFSEIPGSERVVLVAREFDFDNGDKAPSVIEYGKAFEEKLKIATTYRNMGADWYQQEFDWDTNGQPHKHPITWGLNHLDPEISICHQYMPQKDLHEAETTDFVRYRQQRLDHLRGIVAKPSDWEPDPLCGASLRIDYDASDPNPDLSKIVVRTVKYYFYDDAALAKMVDDRGHWLWERQQQLPPPEKDTPRL